MTLDHIGINVPDVRRAADFLITAFGAVEEFAIGPFSDPSGAAMTRIGAPGDCSLELVMLRLATGNIELLGWGGPQVASPAADHSAVIGGAHLAIEVDDIAETLARLGVLPGVEVLSQPLTFTDGPTAGLSNAFVRSDTGLLIELVNWG